jgi:hypothetical protein
MGRRLVRLSLMLSVAISLLGWTKVGLADDPVPFSSQDNRSKLRCCGAYLSFGILGAAVGIVAPINQQWQLEFTHGAQSAINGSKTLDAVHARVFFGNSFNLFFGLASETENYQFPEDNDSRIGGGFGIANDWQFDSGVLLGVDWISVEATTPTLLRVKLGYML